MTDRFFPNPVYCVCMINVCHKRKFINTCLWYSRYVLTLPSSSANASGSDTHSHPQACRFLRFRSLLHPFFVLSSERGFYIVTDSAHTRFSFFDQFRSDSNSGESFALQTPCCFVCVCFFFTAHIHKHYKINIYTTNCMIDGLSRGPSVATRDESPHLSYLIPGTFLPPLRF